MCVIAYFEWYHESLWTPVVPDVSNHLGHLLQCQMQGSICWLDLVLWLCVRRYVEVTHCSCKVDHSQRPHTRDGTTHSFEEIKIFSNGPAIARGQGEKRKEVDSAMQYQNSITWSFLFAINCWQTWRSSLALAEAGKTIESSGRRKVSFKIHGTK